MTNSMSDVHAKIQTTFLHKLTPCVCYAIRHATQIILVTFLYSDFLKGQPANQ